MAGQPKKRAIREELDRRTRELFDAEEGHTALDYAECLVASGMSIRKLAQALSDTLGWEVNREMLRRYLMSLDEAHYADRMKAAQEHGAHAYAEDSIDILDSASPDEASLAAAKSRARQWIAEKWNRREFGRDASVNVSINAATLMLQALEAPPPPRPLDSPAPIARIAPAAPSIETVDADVLPAED